MTRFIIAYLATAVCFLAIDSIWLTLTVDRLYRPRIGAMMLDGFRLAPALAFYFIYILGIVLIAIVPAFHGDGWRHAALNGAMFGFFAYATYDLTNQATLKHWSTTITIVDMAWGATLTSVGATSGYAIATWFVTNPGA